MTQRHLSQPDTTIRQSMLAELDADAYKLTDTHLHLMRIDPPKRQNPDVKQIPHNR